MAGKRNPPRGKSRKDLVLTEVSGVSFADAAEKALAKGVALGKKDGVKITYGEVVKMEMVVGSAVFSVTLRFPEY